MTFLILRIALSLMIVCGPVALLFAFLRMPIAFIFPFSIALGCAVVVVACGLIIFLTGGA